MIPKIYSNFKTLWFVFKIGILQYFQNPFKCIFFITRSLKCFSIPIIFQNEFFVFRELILCLFLAVPGKNHKQFNTFQNSIFNFIHLLLLDFQSRLFIILIYFFVSFTIFFLDFFLVIVIVNFLESFTNVIQKFIFFVEDAFWF